MLDSQRETQMRSLNELFSEISSNNNRWSYYENTNFCIDRKWNDCYDALDFIISYFNYAGKSQCFRDKNIEKHKKSIDKRAPHIISAFLIGIYLFECFGLDSMLRDQDGMNYRYYWFLTCLYHDIGYIYENECTCEQLRMLQTDGLDAIQEVCDIKYMHKREFRTYSMEDIDLYLKGRSACSNGKRGCIDHGIAGGLLLYDKLRQQFEISWNNRTDKCDSRESFYIKDECQDRCLHLSNKHYEAYAKAADAIIAHNIWRDTLNDYIEKRNIPDKPARHASNNRISIQNQLCFILAIADTIEPLKRKLKLEDIRIKSLSNNQGIVLEISDNCNCVAYERGIEQLNGWLTIDVKKSVKNRVTTFQLTLPENSDT